MTVEQAGIVDWVGVEKATGHIHRVVSDHLDWSDEDEHLSLLQDKLNTYLAFIERTADTERARWAIR